MKTKPIILITQIFLFLSMFIFSGYLHAQVLAEKGPYRFTQSDFDKSIRFTEFICGEKLQQADIKLLKKGELYDFELNPAMSLQNIAQIDQQMQQIYAITSPPEVGLARSMLITNIFNTIFNLPDENAFKQVFYKHNTVLAIDPNNGICFTEKDLQAYFDFITFYAGLVGQSMVYDYQTREIFKQDIINQFLYGDLQTKYTLAFMHTFNLYVQGAYQKMTLQEKEQFVHSMSGNYHDYSLNSGHSHQNGNEMFQNNDARTNQLYFNIMQDMMLQQHATGLNIIENIGGTGNYWEVVNY